MSELLGRRIKQLRNVMGHTQEQIAGRLGVSEKKYAQMENGINNNTLETLFKIAEALDVHVRDITKVLDETSEIKHCENSEGNSEQIFEMLDLFYANKHLYMKLQCADKG